MRKFWCKIFHKKHIEIHGAGHVEFAKDYHCNKCGYNWVE